jgi:hypothetical protein
MGVVYRKCRAYAPCLRTCSQPMRHFAAGAPQPALRSGLAPAWRLLHVSRRVVQVAKSRITPQVHRAGRETGAIKPVRVRAGSGLNAVQQGAVWAGYTCADAHMGICFSFSVARVSLILPPSRSATRRGASKCNTGPINRTPCFSRIRVKYCSPGYTEQSTSRGHRRPHHGTSRTGVT